MLHETLDTQLCFSSTYHPQTDGQTERVNQILEYMLKACALQYGKSWDKSLPYDKFSYNNSYQESLKMAPFEMFWSEAGERKVFGPDILQEAEKQVHMVRENLRVAQSRHKLWSWRLCIPQGVTYERFLSFQGPRQARTEVHWTIQDFGEERWSG
jgi:hypothetical protein